MPTSSMLHDGRWVVSGPAAALARIAPLIEAHRKQRPVTVLEDAAAVVSHLKDAAGVLLIGEGTPLKSLTGVFLHYNERRIPVGWLPNAGNRLEVYAHTAAELQNRIKSTTECGPLVLLGENSQRALELAGHVARETETSIPVFQWTSERIVRDDLIDALRTGPGLAMYFGHSIPQGWLGYTGFDKSDAAQACGRPIGVVLSISCSTADRPTEGLSFAEELVLGGLCGAALGAVRRTIHTRNQRLGLAFARALQSAEVRTLADLLLTIKISQRALAHYRILGDPLAPIIGDAEAAVRAAAVFAPAPNDPLPVIPLSSWKEGEFPFRSLH